MADGRRTRWVAHDVYFLDEGLGHAMFERFGACGVALWHGFIAACKKNHIEGQTSWASDVEAMTVFGLPGMSLVDNDGVPFELGDWLNLLSDHKVIRRTSRGRRVKVTCTKWTRWQQAARRQKKAEGQAERRDTEGQQNRRSDPDFVGTPPAHNGPETGPKGAQMTDTDTDSKTLMSDVPSDPDVSDDAQALTREFATAVKANGHSIPSRQSKARNTWLVEMDRLLRLGPPGEGGHVPTVDEVRQVIRFVTTDDFEKANVQSVPKLRERFASLRIKATRGNGRPDPSEMRKSVNSGMYREFDPDRAEREARELEQRLGISP